MRKIILGLCFLLLASGCSNTLPKQSFNKAANPHIQNIAISNPPPVKKVEVSILAHPGSSFGLIGGMVALADTASKTGRYNQSTGQIDWEAYITQQIAEELQKAGFRTGQVKLRSAKNTRKKYLKKYPAISSDAILDYYFAVGQIAAGATTNYVPTVKVAARLIDAKNKTVLYEEQFTAGLASRKGQVNFPPTKEYADIRALVNNAPESVAALKLGIQQIAQRIASDLSQ